MSDENERRERVPVWLHHAGAIVCGLIGVVFGVVLSKGLTSQQIMQSVIVGLAIGLPYTIFSKWDMRKNAGFYVESFTHTAGWRRKQWKYWRSVMPAHIAFMGILTISLFTNIKAGPGLGVLIALTVLSYPEQRILWRMANEKLAETKCHNPRDDAK